MRLGGGSEDTQATVARLVPGLPAYERKFDRAVPLIDPRPSDDHLASDAIPESAVPATVGKRDTLYRRGLAAADALSTTVALVVAVTLLGDDRLTFAALAIAPLIVLVSKVIGLYDRDEHLIRRTTLDEIPALFEVATLYTLVAWFAESLYVDGALAKVQVFALWLMVFLSMAISRELVRQAVKRATQPERCLVLGDATIAARLEQKFSMSYSMRVDMVGRVPFDAEPLGAATDGPQVLGTIRTLPLVIETHEIERVIVAPGSATSEEMLAAIRRIKAHGPKVSVVPRLLDVVGSSVEFDDVDGITLLGLRGFGLSKSSKLMKRGLDMAGALAVLAVIGPLLAMLALTVKLTSPGPVFFRQRRIGRDGVPFQMLKFRTMVDGADAQKAKLAELNEAADGLFKISDDPRLTSVGRFLRRASLDELPQLLNVLRGEMSLVGPRPLVLDEDRNIKGWERQRLNVAPGMTGFWQILGSSRVPRDEMVKIDYLYGANWSLWLDVKILLRTVPHVLARRGL
jgi:exopolysaccharide biosynthesis polyprenyl glycosylphosphotransferase